MSYYNWREFFMALENWGLSDVLLPFLLIFTIVYAIFYKTKILGEKKSYSAVVALVLGMMTVIPHVTGSYPFGWDPVEIIKGFLPRISLIVIALIMLLLIIGVWGAESDWIAGNTVTGGIVMLSIVAVVWIFGASANWWQGWGWFERIFGSDALAIVVMILVFALVMWFITRDEGQSQGDGFMKQLGGFFKKP